MSVEICLGKAAVFSGGVVVDLFEIKFPFAVWLVLAKENVTEQLSSNGPVLVPAECRLLLVWHCEYCE